MPGNGPSPAHIPANPDQELQIVLRPGEEVCSALVDLLRVRLASKHCSAVMLHSLLAHCNPCILHAFVSCRIFRHGFRWEARGPYQHGWMEILDFLALKHAVLKLLSHLFFGILQADVDVDLTIKVLTLLTAALDAADANVNARLRLRFVESALAKGLLTQPHAFCNTLCFMCQVYTSVFRLRACIMHLKRRPYT